MNTKTCTCGAELLMVATERGRRMPLLKTSERRAFVIDQLADGSKVCRSVVVYDSHFSDCPHADAHRSVA